MGNYDISKASRDELQFVLSTAKNEWKKYVDCENEVKNCENGIEREKKIITQPNGCGLMLVTIGMWFCFFVFVCLLLGCGYVFYFQNILQNDPERLVVILPTLLLILLLAILCFVSRSQESKKVKTDKENAINNIEKYEAQLPELQKKEEEAKNELKEIRKIPFAFWDERTLSAMLQYINEKTIDSWKELVAQYKEDEFRRLMLENAQMTLEEARKRTEIALQTRDAARLAAFGSLVTAGGVLRINSKL